MKETAALSEAESRSVSASIKKVKMEDRKRPLNDQNDEHQPQSKRQAVTAPSNSGSVPQGQEDVIHFQKEAIFRQMQVYKREKELAESKLEDLIKRSIYHDNHLRVIDAWWQQLIDELRLRIDTEISLPNDDEETFQEHLSSKKGYIVDNLSSLFESVKLGKNNISAGEKVQKLEKHVAELLAGEKAYKVELDSLRSEKEDFKQQLTDAAIRYLQAEKKLDRLKSITLAKIEKQATQQTTETKTEGTNNEANSTSKVTDSQLADAELARKEAQAIASKQEKELKQLQSDNTRLSEQVSKYTIKFSRLAEEDILSCDVYKNVKAKLDDLVVRYNHIEALNNNLLKETEKLQADRTTYKNLLEREQENAINEMNAQMSKNDSDLARIRAVRDEAVQDATMRKAAADKHLSYVNETNELAAARSLRIESMEIEMKRLRLELDTKRSEPDTEITLLTHEDLLAKYTQLDQAYKILEEELPALEAAYKKAHELGSDKVINLQEASAKMDRLVQEKVKADQKYFTAMKAKETLMQENRLLKNQHSKSSEIISQLKDAEKSLATTTANLEKQLSELRNIQHLASAQAKDYQRRILEGSNTIESLKTQVSRLTDAVKTKDANLSSETEARRKAEFELERTMVKLETAEQKYETHVRQESSDEHVEALRSMVRCPICRHRLKNMVIMSCGHVFCKECTEERMNTRLRKCPTCGRPFARNDMLQIHI